MHLSASQAMAKPSWKKERVFPGSPPPSFALYFDVCACQRCFHMDGPSSTISLLFSFCKFHLLSPGGVVTTGKVGTPHSVFFVFFFFFTFLLMLLKISRTIFAAAAAAAATTLILYFAFPLVSFILQGELTRFYVTGGCFPLQSEAPSWFHITHTLYCGAY